MTPQRERLTARRRAVLAYVDEHGEISLDDGAREWGMARSSIHLTLQKMHAAKLLRIRRWQRQKQGPFAPFFMRYDGMPDAQRPKALTDAQKVKRYRQRLRDGKPKTTVATKSIFDLFVVQPLRRAA